MSSSNLRVSVVTGNSKSGSACVKELLTRYKSSIKLLKASFRSDSKADSLRKADYFDANLVQICSDVSADNKESLLNAFRDTDFALIVTPHDPTSGMSRDAELTCNMIHAAVESGVKHIVVVGSWTVKAPQHLPTLSSRFIPSETLLKELEVSKGLKWSVLRGGYFFDNISYAVKNNVVSIPAHYAVAAVCVEDIGKSAAAIFASDDTSKHHGKCYEMCGPAVLTGDDIANILSEKLDRKITHFAFSPGPEVLKNLPLYLQELITYFAIEKEKSCPFTNSVQQLTGQWTSFGEWVSNNKDLFP